MKESEATCISRPLDPDLFVDTKIDPPITHKIIVFDDEIIVIQYHDTRGRRRAQPSPTLTPATRGTGTRTPKGIAHSMAQFYYLIRANESRWNYIVILYPIKKESYYDAGMFAKDISRWNGKQKTKIDYILGVAQSLCGYCLVGVCTDKIECTKADTIFFPYPDHNRKMVAEQLKDTVRDFAPQLSSKQKLYYHTRTIDSPRVTYITPEIPLPQMAFDYNNDNYSVTMLGSMAEYEELINSGGYRNMKYEDVVKQTKQEIEKYKNGEECFLQLKRIGLWECLLSGDEPQKKIENGVAVYYWNNVVILRDENNWTRFPTVYTIYAPVEKFTHDIIHIGQTTDEFNRMADHTGKNTFPKGNCGNALYEYLYDGRNRAIKDGNSTDPNDYYFNSMDVAKIVEMFVELGKTPKTALLLIEARVQQLFIEGTVRLYNQRNMYDYCIEKQDTKNKYKDRTEKYKELCTNAYENGITNYIDPVGKALMQNNYPENPFDPQPEPIIVKFTQYIGNKFIEADYEIFVNAEVYSAMGRCKTIEELERTKETLLKITTHEREHLNMLYVRKYNEQDGQYHTTERRTDDYYRKLLDNAFEIGRNRIERQ